MNIIKTSVEARRALKPHPSRVVLRSNNDNNDASMKLIHTRTFARTPKKAHFAFVPSFELTVLRPSKCFRLASLARAANVCQNPTTARSLLFAPLSRSTNRFTRPSSIDDRVESSSVDALARAVLGRRAAVAARDRAAGPRVVARAAVAPRVSMPRRVADCGRRHRASEACARRRRASRPASRPRATDDDAASRVASSRAPRARTRPRRRRAGNPRRTTRRASPSSARSKSRRSARRSADGRAGERSGNRRGWRWSCR